MRYHLRIPLLYVAAIVGALLLSHSKIHAQFSGSASVSANASSNVTGTDTSAADRIISPSINLQYKIPVSDPFSITFGASAVSNLYTESPSRSYEQYAISGIAEYLFLPSLAPKAIPHTSQSSTSQQKPIETQTKKEMALSDTIVAVSLRLASLSETLDSIEVDTLGIDEDSIDVASELKDSLSESVLAIGQILATESFTESIQQVLIEELQADIALAKQIPFRRGMREKVFSILDQSKNRLNNARAGSDIISLTPAPIESPDLPPKVTEALHSNLFSEPAPAITLVDGETEITQFSSLDIEIKDNALPKTNKTLATAITLPLHYQSQINRDEYSAFSNSQYYLRPRFSYYLSSGVGLGGQYEYYRLVYANDTLFTFSQQTVRIDSRIELASWFVLGAQVSFKTRTYDHPPVDSVVRIPRGGLVPVYNDGVFSRVEFGLTTTAFASELISVGIGTAFTRASDLRPYFHDLQLRSIIGGPAADDEFSYKLSKVFFYCNSRILWDINTAFDVSYEYRKYGRGTVLAKQAPRFDDRNDHGFVAQADISYDILFDDRLFSVFEAITPELILQYSTFTSSIKQYRFNDFSGLFNLTVAF